MTTRRPAWLPLGVALLLKLTVSVALLLGGFHAISDDDFARVAIAQGFAAAPALDPSGTSWLPLPFWLTGGCMLIFGNDFMVARGVALALGLVATALCYLSARWLGMAAKPSAVGAALATLFPYAALLGVATVPEAFSAACVVAGVASCARAEVSARLLGAVLLSLASLCRYEAWPVAFGFAAYCCWDAVRSLRQPPAPGRGHAGALLAAGLLALSGAGLWLLHGAHSHGDALFFVDRVAAYRRAVGAAPASIWARLLGYPLGFLRGEPELVLGAACASAWAWLAQRRAGATAAAATPLNGSRWLRPWLLLCLMLASLIYGDLRDGAPTHHAERAVLALWTLGALWFVHVCWVLLREPERRRRAAALGLACLLLGGLILRPWYARRDSFIDRTQALAAGAAARQLGAERLGVATTDFGFYAVMVGYRAPPDVVSLRDNDPRSRDAIDPLGSPGVLRAALAAADVRWVALPTSHAALALAVGEERFKNQRWIIVTLR